MVKGKQYVGIVTQGHSPAKVRDLRLMVFVNGRKPAPVRGQACASALSRAMWARPKREAAAMQRRAQHPHRRLLEHLELVASTVSALRRRPLEPPVAIRQQDTDRHPGQNRAAREIVALAADVARERSHQRAPVTRHAEAVPRLAVETRVPEEELVPEPLPAPKKLTPCCSRKNLLDHIEGRQLRRPTLKLLDQLLRQRPRAERTGCPACSENS